MFSPFRYAQETLRKGGYGMINRLMYGDNAPVFQIDIPQSFDLFCLKKLLSYLPKISTELEEMVHETPLKGKHDL